MTKIVKIIISIILGIFITFLLLEIFLRLFGWWQLNRLNFFQPVVNSKKEYIILALGDSMTALGGDSSYPKLLEKILNDSGKFSKKVKVINGGVIASTSRDLLFNIEENINKFKPDIVMTMMGSNDYKVIYETSSGLNSNDLLMNFKSYKLIRFIGKNLIDILKNNSREWVYLKYGDYYASKGNLREAKINYEKGLSLFPNSDLLYIRMIPYLSSFDMKEKYCIKGIELNPKRVINEQCLVDLYSKYDRDKEFSLLNNAIKILPNSTILKFELGKLSFMNGKYDEAENFLIDATRDKNFEKPIKIYDLLGKIYSYQNRTEDLNKVKEIIVELSRETSRNYPILASTLSKRNISLVAIQYPRRDINVLKTYLKNFTNTYFVDNNQSFEDAVAKYGFDKVFIDAFAGDFGHGSSLGNKIIAQNVAKVILEQVLNNEKHN